MTFYNFATVVFYRCIFFYYSNTFLVDNTQNIYIKQTCLKIIIFYYWRNNLHILFLTQEKLF